jgi:hypothetical protein
MQTHTEEAMGLHQVDQTVVTTESEVAGSPPPDALWAPETEPATSTLAAPVAPAPVVWVQPVAAPVAPVAPTTVVWAAPVEAPLAPAAAPLAVAPVAQQTVQTYRRRTTRTSFENAELTRRIVLLVFGLIELFIGMRVVLLLLDARTTNGLVSGIMSLSGPFVAPFQGILRTNSVTTSGSVLDVAALLALAGWAVVEMVVFWVLATFRREPA